MGVVLLDEDEISSINEIHNYITSTSLTSHEDIKKLSKLNSKLPKSMETFMEQLKVFTNLIYTLFTSFPPLFLKLKTSIRSLMEYKPSARALIKKQQRVAMVWIITLQTKHFFRGESNKLAEFVIMKNNLREKIP